MLAHGTHASEVKDGTAADAKNESSKRGAVSDDTDGGTSRAEGSNAEPAIAGHAVIEQAGAGSAGGGGRGDGAGGGAAGSGGGGHAGAPDANAGAGGAAALPTSVVGLWSGIGVDVVGPMFDMCIRIEQMDMPGGTAGSAVYRGRDSARNLVNCETELTFVEISNELFKFHEVVTRGSGCFSPAEIELKFNPDGSLNYDWYRSGGAIPQEKGTLHKVETCATPSQP